MNASDLYHGFVMLHIIGLVTIAGTTMIDYITFRLFWNLQAKGDDKCVGLLPIMSHFGTIIRTGVAVSLISGVVIVVQSHGAWSGQLWFKIKMFVVLMLLINGIFVGHRQGVKLRETAARYEPGFAQQVSGTRTRLEWFYRVQLTLFFAVILLSVFKFT